MIYIKYKDTQVNTAKFISQKQIDGMEMAVIELVGFLVHEDDEKVLVAHTKTGKKYKHTYVIHKENIIEMSDKLPEGTIETSFKDNQFTSNAMTKEQLLKHYKPKILEKIGWDVGEGKIAFEKSDGLYRTVSVYE